MDTRPSLMQSEPLQYLPGLSFGAIMKEQGIMRTLCSVPGSCAQESFLIFMHAVGRLQGSSKTEGPLNMALIGRKMMVQGCGVRDGHYDMVWIPRTDTIFAVYSSDHDYVCQLQHL